MSQNNRQAWLMAAAGAGAVVAIRSLLRRPRYDLRDRTVLITGGSRGLGLVLARQAVAQGARVGICGRDAIVLRAAVDDLTERGGRAHSVACDVGSSEQVNSMVAEVEAELGPVDVLINNAGIIQVGPLDTLTIEDFERAMRTHFWGPLHATLAVLPSMRRRGEGRIANISSIGGKIGVPHLVPYSASKFALVGLSEGLRAELAHEGIMVTTVCPGLMRTGSPRNATFKGRHRAEYAWFSISDSIPGPSISVERAARQIIAAARRGAAHLVISWPAKLAVGFHGVFPGLTADLMALANRMLPGAGGIGRSGAAGKDSVSAVSPSILTALTERAARRNNEMIEPLG